jgi:hypothetical protein
MGNKLRDFKNNAFSRAGYYREKERRSVPRNIVLCCA